MEDLLRNFFPELLDRLEGPISFRFVFQPIMALVFAMRDGRRDARKGNVPYFWHLFTDPAHLREILADGWKGIYRVFLLAIALDLVYQYLVIHQFRPVQALVVATALALLPYMLLRGPFNRLAMHAARHGWKGLRP